MKVASSLVLLPALCSALPSLRKSARQWSGWGPNNSAAEAAYFLRVDPAGSTIVAIEVGSDGMLTSSTTSTSTGGVGQQSQNFTDNLAPTVIDPLQGQQAVAVGDDYLFTVNSGSDTVAMFSINPKNPLELTMVGSPAASLGQFPMSVAYSAPYQKLCVLKGGAVNGVACYSVSAQDGLVPDGVGLRSYGFNATTPAQLFGYSGSGSDIQFSIDSAKLITTFKGTAAPGALGHITVLDVDSNGNVASTFTDNQVAPIGAAFGFALTGNDASQFLISIAAGLSGALVSLDYDTNDVSLLAMNNVSSYKASCWAVWSPENDYYYQINAGSPNIGVLNDAGDLLTTINYKKSLGGATDSVVAGSMIYQLTATNIIQVLDTSTNKAVQHYKYSTPEDRPFWTGMAMYPSSPLLTGGSGGGWSGQW